MAQKRTSRTTKQSPPRVAVIGHSCVDFYLQTPGWPGPGERKLADWPGSYPGGNGLNLSVDLAKLGCRVELLTGLSDDKTVGLGLRTFLRSRGVYVYYQHQKGFPIGMTVITSYGDGEPSFVQLLGATTLITPSVVREAQGKGFMKRVDMVMVVGLGVVPGLDSDAERVDELADVLETLDKDVLVSADLALFSGDDSDWGSRMKRLLPHVDFFTPNLAEARQLLGAEKVPVDGESDVRKRAAKVRKLAAAAGRALIRQFEVREAVVVKCGPDGCLLAARDGGKVKTGFVSAPEVPVADPTGAGDAFLAGFSHHILLNRRRKPRWEMLLEACVAGNQCGTLCVAQLGSTTWTTEPLANN